MFSRPDMTVKEVSAPHDLQCRSGHEAPKMFRRAGLTAPEEPTRFFQVSATHDPNVNGIYCEPCLIIANAMSTKNQMRIE